MLLFLFPSSEEKTKYNGVILTFATEHWCFKLLCYVLFIRLLTEKLRTGKNILLSLKETKLSPDTRKAMVQLRWNKKYFHGSIYWWNSCHFLILCHLWERDLTFAKNANGWIKYSPFLKWLHFDVLVELIVRRRNLPC